ncbi:hypothetical protein KIW84_034747 [Lathyrus oleraceus]|uniref:PPM-type phosphatase domain-containing protein n=1 Tax=Pisum sativum TaxID=3888 RepID=A0A9D4VHQ7_PEA|nr:hypothetical protein KIW84_070929 [Pisum sativum]KAI5400598.1 hypothetical protein KIW84_065474 [Pisum sativum]KAI5430278.1 hypothetical protein KIW84_034747 [Pisum sativum]
MTVYKNGGAPAVFQSPKCPRWRLFDYDSSPRTATRCQSSMLQGRRKSQEDRTLCVLDVRIPFPGTMGIREVVVGIVAVFDGHNGAEASEMASKLLMEYFVLHTYFLLDAMYSVVSKTSTGKLLHRRDHDHGNLLHRWKEILGWQWHELHSERLQNVFSANFDDSFHLEILKEALLRAIHDIDVRFSEEASRNNIHSGSTATVVLVADDKFLVANIGDSKAFLCSENFQSPKEAKASLLELYRQTERDGSVSVWDREKYRLASSHGLNHFAVKELTRDHHPDREDERTRVEAAGGQVLNWGGLPRVNGQLAITRAIVMEEELPAPTDENVDERYHFTSLILNLVNTFLYMVNTYIIVPTADDYSMHLGAAPTVCGIVIGAMAVAQLFSSVYFSAWSNKSYFRPLVFSSIILFLGNTMYALAYDFNSIWILLIGRLCCGFGSARAVNRRYISDCVPLKIRIQASAGFVSASALGMACGPALAGLLQTNFKIYNVTFNQDTLPGWVMTIAWLIYSIWLWISFVEPSREFEEDRKTDKSQKSNAEDSDALEKGLQQPLLITSEDKVDEDADQDNDDSEEAPEESRQPATSIGSAYRLLTPSVKVQLLIYFMLKYVMEILLAESSVITTYYFKWSTGTVAIFLAGLGLTVLPINIIVGSYVSNWFDDRQILLASEIMVLIGIVSAFHVIIPYSELQYICSGLLMFVSAEVLEGVYMQGHQQDNGWACGYYVMKNMFDIIDACIVERFNEIFTDTSSYEKESIDHIRQLWAQFFLQKVEEQENQEKKDLMTKQKRLKKTYI